MVETMDKESIFYPMTRTSMNVLLETLPCFGNRFIRLLLEAGNLPMKGALVLPIGKNFLRNALAHFSQVVASSLLA